MWVKVGIPGQIGTLQAILGSEGPKKGHEQAQTGSSASKFKFLLFFIKEMKISIKITQFDF